MRNSPCPPATSLLFFAPAPPPFCFNSALSKTLFFFCFALPFFLANNAFAAISLHFLYNCQDYVVVVVVITVCRSNRIPPTSFRLPNFHHISCIRRNISQSLHPPLLTDTCFFASVGPTANFVVGH